MIRATRLVSFQGAGSLGRDRVLLGCPGADAVSLKGSIHYLVTSAQAPS